MLVLAVVAVVSCMAASFDVVVVAVDGAAPVDVDADAVADVVIMVADVLLLLPLW